MKKLIMTAALALGLASPAYAQVTVCGPDNGNGCEQQNEQKIFLNEGHDQSFITGNVGGNNSGPAVLITADTGTFDTTLDSGGGFATIDASHGFKAFNGVDITIPGYTFTDLVFEVQMERQGGKKGDTELDQFEIKAGDLGTFLADAERVGQPRRPVPVQRASHGRRARRIEPVRRQFASVGRVFRDQAPSSVWP